MTVPTLLFQRNARVTITEIPNILDNKAKIIDQLFIKFNVVKSTKSETNKGRIAIYNLSEASRNFIDARKPVSVRPVIKLEVGYQGEYQLLFVGDIKRTNSEKRGPDWVTTIEAEDGDELLHRSNFARNFKAGTSEGQIVQDILKEVGLLSNNIKAELTGDGENIKHSVTLDGAIFSLMDQYISNMEKEWSVQDGAVQITVPGAVIDAPTIDLSEKTGLIGSPIKTDKGIKLKALIQAGFQPGRGINVTSRLMPKGAFYRIEQTTFNGETRGPQWMATIEASKTEVNPTVGIPLQFDQIENVA